MKQIELTQGKIALVDDDIYELVKDYSWCAHKKDGNLWYAERASSRLDDPNYKQHTIRLHNLVIGKPPKGFMVGHIDGNGLNNQRNNLHFVTNRQNQGEQKKHRNGRLVGVYYRKQSKRWLSQIIIDGKKRHLGSFGTEQEAHEAYLKVLEKI